MTKTHFTHGGKIHTELRADVPMQIMPKIIREYIEDGHRYYRSEDNRLFDAERFDNYWMCRVKRPTHGKYHKGTNPNSFTALMFDQI